MDDYVPLNLNKNITLIKKKKTFFKYNFFYLTKIFVLLVIEYRFSLKKILHYFSYHSYFAKQMSLIVKKILKRNNYKTILMPYEAQPFHQLSFPKQRILTKKSGPLVTFIPLYRPFPVILSTDLVRRTCY